MLLPALVDIAGSVSRLVDSPSPASRYSRYLLFESRHGGTCQANTQTLAKSKPEGPQEAVDNGVFDGGDYAMEIERTFSMGST